MSDLSVPLQILYHDAGDHVYYVNNNRRIQIGDDYWCLPMDVHMSTIRDRGRGQSGSHLSELCEFMEQEIYMMSQSKFGVGPDALPDYKKNCDDAYQVTNI